MRVLLLHSHPVESSYGRALHATTLAALRQAGHEVDNCNLYEEGFDPVMSREDRLTYHDYPANTTRVKPYVDRLLAAEAIVIVTPIWNFGWPAILKGYFDRVWLPGVSFQMTGEAGDRGAYVSMLGHIRKLAVVLTYGSTPIRAWLAGDPPRKIVKRVLRGEIGVKKPVKFLAHYDMNNCTPESRAKFLSRVKAEMERF